MSLRVAQEPAQLRQQLGRRRAAPVERVDPVEPGEDAGVVHASTVARQA